jgi:hypothetical protein
LPMGTLGSKMSGMPAVYEFAHFSDADWWNFWIGLATAVGTVGAVVVAVVDSVRSSRRAERAVRRADNAEAVQLAQDRLLMHQARGKDAAGVARIDADIAKITGWLTVAENYEDEPRALQLRATLLELQAERQRLMGDD